MSNQMVIVDLQSRFSKGNNFDIVANNIAINSHKYNAFLLIVDITDGSHLDFPPALLIENKISSDEKSYLFDPYFHPRINKQYGFLRNFMDEGISDEDIVYFGKWLLSRNTFDAEDVYEDDELWNSFKKEFSQSILINYNFKNYTFKLPIELMGLSFY